MCGIVGYVGKRPAIDVLLGGLKRLEYRGYDSAGVAYFEEDRIEIKKSEGKLANVQKLMMGQDHKHVTCGIGHTRWATHGKPTTQNAHPHKTHQIVLVHNGVIENYEHIKEKMIQEGYHPESETDSELFGFLILEELKKTDSLVDAARKAFLQLEGTSCVVLMSEDNPDLIIGIRNGLPLVASTDPQGGVIIASDAQPIIEYTKDVVFMENGDMVIGTRSGLKFVDLQSGKEIQRKSTKIDWSADKMDKQGFPHYMLKEIYEQPMALVDTLNGVLDRARTDPFPLAQQPGVDILRHAEEITFIACGTSWHATLLAKYWLERWSGVSVNVELASEFRYRDPVLRRNTVVVGVSQSGETADTLAVIRELRRRGIPTIGVTNVRGSTIAREADAAFFTSAGPEIGVAATKSFMTQLLMMFMWAGFLGLQRGKDTAARVPALFDQLLKVPHMIESSLQASHGVVKQCREAAKKLDHVKGFFFMGRGYQFPVALEGALKLKEIAYVHAEGYAAGELKHGPIAMLEPNMAVVVLAPQDAWYEKTVSNLQEVKARGAVIVGVGSPEDQSLKNHCDIWIPLPIGPNSKDFDQSLFPFFSTLVIQLLSYELAVLKGTDVDQPRNLAKSVTVE